MKGNRCLALYTRKEKADATWDVLSGLFLTEATTLCLALLHSNTPSLLPFEIVHQGVLLKPRTCCPHSQVKILLHFSSFTSAIPLLLPFQDTALAPLTRKLAP
jgi:hypothetical protein